MIQLPADIQHSTVLSAAHLQQLSNIVEIPAINPAFEDDFLKNIFQYYSLTPDVMELELHRYAATLLSQNKVDEAWQVLLSL